MKKKTATKKPEEMPLPNKQQEINQPADPKEPVIPAEDPDVIPDEDPYKPSPEELPAPDKDPQ